MIHFARDQLAWLRLVGATPEEEPPADGGVRLFSVAEVLDDSLRLREVAAEAGEEIHAGPPDRPGGRVIVHHDRAASPWPPAAALERRPVRGHLLHAHDVYEFRSVIVAAAGLPDGRYELALAPPKVASLRRIQRRGFYRLPCRLALRYYLEVDAAEVRRPKGAARPSPGDLFESASHPVYRGVALDLSGSGVRAGVEGDLRVDAVLFLAFDPATDLPGPLAARVVRRLPAGGIRLLEDRRARVAAQVALRFQDLERPLQDRIVRYVFARDRELRRPPA